MVNKYSTSNDLKNLFPLDTKFITNMGYQKKTTLSNIVNGVTAGLHQAADAAQDLAEGAHQAGAERLTALGVADEGELGNFRGQVNPGADEWHYIQRHWAPYLLFSCTFLCVYISGMSLHCKEFKKEQEENKKNLAREEKGELSENEPLVVSEDKDCPRISATQEATMV